MEGLSGGSSEPGQRNLHTGVSSWGKIKGKRKNKIDSLTLLRIEPHSTKRIADAAKELEVSKSTLKRALRRLGVRRWPYTSTATTKEAIQLPEGEIGISTSETGKRSADIPVSYEAKPASVVLEPKDPQMQYLTPQDFEQMQQSITATNTQSVSNSLFPEFVFNDVHDNGEFADFGGFQILCDPYIDRPGEDDLSDYLNSLLE